MKNLYEKLDKISCYLVIATVFILMGNNNNTPQMFIGRIFKPIKIQGATIHYAGFIAIAGIYYALKNLNKIKEHILIKTEFRRIVLTIVVLICFQYIWVYCIQFYKGFSKDLNSIYLNREKTAVEFVKYENVFKVNGLLQIKNCSNKMQEFYIKIKVPSMVNDDITEDYIVLKDSYIISGYEEKELFIDEVLNNNLESYNFEYWTNDFEFILFNNNEETIFNGTWESDI